MLLHPSGESTMFTLTQDLRFALRQLRKSPGYAVVAIVTLALGIGANTAIFLLTYTILLKSLPVPNPGELIRYTSANAESDVGLSYPQYQALRDQQSCHRVCCMAVQRSDDHARWTCAGDSASRSRLEASFLSADAPRTRPRLRCEGRRERQWLATGGSPEL